jgi:hypothetical protein
MRATQGQAAVELVAVLPFVAIVCALAWQLALAGHAAWSVASAARAAARAHAIGLEPEPAARGALTRSLERGMKVRLLDGAGGGVRVSVVIPSVARFLALGSASASARFAPQTEDR